MVFDALPSPGFGRSPLSDSPTALARIGAALRAFGGALRRGFVATVEVWIEAQEMRHEMRRRYPRVWHIPAAALSSADRAEDRARDEAQLAAASRYC